MNTPQSSRKVAIARQAGGSGKDHDAGFQPAPTRAMPAVAPLVAPAAGRNRLSCWSPPPGGGLGGAKRSAEG